jgi:hypothetical protein
MTPLPPVITVVVVTGTTTTTEEAGGVDVIVGVRVGVGVTVTVSVGVSVGVAVGVTVDVIGGKGMNVKPSAHVYIQNPPVALLKLLPGHKLTMSDEYCVQLTAIRFR